MNRIFLILPTRRGEQKKKKKQATTRNILDAGRTLLVWVTFVTIGGDMGEKLGWYSWIEAGGFLLRRRHQPDGGPLRVLVRVERARALPPPARPRTLVVGSMCLSIVSSGVSSWWLVLGGVFRRCFGCF